MLLLPIIGPSMSGKTSLVTFASAALGIPEIVSHTTRPMRTGERNGVEHHFDKSIPKDIHLDAEGNIADSALNPHLLASTTFGGYAYWVRWDDPLLSDEYNHTHLLMYVIDEDGLRSLVNNPKSHSAFDAILPIYIDRPEQECDDALSRRMAQMRAKRDANRHELPRMAYYKVILNDRSLEYAQYIFTRTIAGIQHDIQIGEEYSLLKWYSFHAQWLK